MDGKSVEDDGAREREVERGNKEEMCTNPFDRLPDEIVLMIVKMVLRETGKATTKTWRNVTNEKLDNDEVARLNMLGKIAETSARFSRIAMDQSLNSELQNLTIDRPEHFDLPFNQETLNNAVRFLGHQLKKLTLKFCDTSTLLKLRERYEVRLSKDQIMAIVNRCPNLEELNTSNVILESWPQFGAPWGLKQLKINYSLSLWDTDQSDPRRGFNMDIFKDMTRFHHIHHILPQLEVFSLELSMSPTWRLSDSVSDQVPFWMPDLSKCKHLREVNVRVRGRLSYFYEGVPQEKLDSLNLDIYELGRVGRCPHHGGGTFLGLFNRSTDSIDYKQPIFMQHPIQIIK